MFASDPNLFSRIVGDNWEFRHSQWLVWTLLVTDLLNIILNNIWGIRCLEERCEGRTEDMDYECDENGLRMQWIWVGPLQLVHNTTNTLPTRNCTELFKKKENRGTCICYTIESRQTIQRAIPFTLCSFDIIMLRFVIWSKGRCNIYNLLANPLFPLLTIRWG